MIGMKTTREGRRFVLLALLIAIAAVNTGNNLIYLILALMVSLAVLAVVLLKANLSGLTMEVSLDGPVFAGEPAYAAVLIRNNKRFIPSYSLRVTCEGAVSPVYCAMIPPKGTLERVVRVRFKTRGMHGSRDFFVESGFPFILLSDRRTAGGPGETLVYPALAETRGMMAGASGSSGAEALVRGAAGDEIYSIREYRHGDDRRRIHWKATAKTGGLMVKEYAAGESTKATIVIDNLAGVAGAEEKIPSTEVFEKVVSIAGSLARDLIEWGYPVRVITCRKVVPFGAGRDHLFRILDVLALLAEEPSWDSPLPGGEDLLVFVLKSRKNSSNLPLVPSETVIYADNL